MSGMVSDIVLIDENDKRIDGRALDEMRDVTITAGVLNRADGSCYVEWGKNKILAAVYGPREAKPRHIQNPLKAVVQCRYNMAPFSVGDRKRPGPDRRSVEISKITAESLEPVIMTELFPRASIDIYIEVLEAEAGTRCAGVTAASVALADAGIPMTSLVAACAAGKAGGKVVLDLKKEEDNYGEADLPVAVVERTGDITLMQLDGDMSMDEFNHAFELAVNGCKKLHSLQREALKKKYERIDAAKEAVA